MENIESIWEDTGDVIEVGDALVLFLRHEGYVYSIKLLALLGTAADTIDIKAAPGYGNFFSGEICITNGTTCAEVLSALKKSDLGEATTLNFIKMQL